MKSVLRRAILFVEGRPAGSCVLLAVVTLCIDFLTGREVRFPLLYVLPISLTAWVGNKAMAYGMSLLLPLVRVIFENLWQTPESLPVEGLNAVLEVLALSLYVYLVGRQGARTRQMKDTITTREEEMQHLRAFTRVVGATLQGRGISPGLADGVAMIYVPEQDAEFGGGRISGDEVAREVGRLDRALEASVSELDEIRRKSEIERADDRVTMVEMRLAMLGDPSLVEACRRRVRQDLVRAEQAVIEEIRRLEQMIHGLKHEFMRARSADVRDIGRQILRNLRTPGKDSPHRLASLPPGTVLVATEFLLSDALQMDTDNLAAIVTEKMGPASHAAILARVRRLPAVCDIKDATTVLASGDHLLVDAETGTVTVAPTRTQAVSFEQRKAQAALFYNAAASDPILPCGTKDGAAIGLHANISRPDEAVVVLEHQLDGVGLFRSEFLFLHAEQPPDLDSQTAAYSEVAAMLDPRPVVIRTMDLGGDKMPQSGRTANILALQAGLRGLAFSLAEKTMFRTQLIAIVRSAQKGNVRIMFPMVMGVADLTEARELVDEVLQSESPGKQLSVGAMIETPAAAFDIHGILGIADFVSIGTNDLAHSILSMDRGSQGHPGVLSFLHPSVLRATDHVVQAARKRGVAVSVCGETASDPAAAFLLIGMGVRDFSINPFLAARVRHTIHRVALDRAQAVAKDALGANIREEVQEILASALRETASQG